MDAESEEDLFMSEDENYEEEVRQRRRKKRDSRSKAGVDRELRSQSLPVRSSSRSRKSTVSASAREKFIQQTGATVERRR